MDLLKPSLGQKTLEKKEKSVLVNPFSRFTKTTDFLSKILGLKGKGSYFQKKVQIGENLEEGQRPPPSRQDSAPGLY